MSGPVMARDQVVDVLIEIARRAAKDVNADHPVDIGYAMAGAIESAGVTLQVLREAGHIQWSYRIGVGVA